MSGGGRGGAVCLRPSRLVCVQDNLLHGRFLAELTKEVFTDLEASKYQHAEYRISIYGRKRVEWDILAAWICQNRLCSDNVVWLIQVYDSPHKRWKLGRKPCSVPILLHQKAASESMFS